MNIKALVVAVAAYAVAEAAWLVSMRPAYARWFARFAKGGELRLRSIPAAALTYLIIVAGFVLLVIDRTSNASSSRSSTQQHALRGAMYGLALYGVYNLTNAATLPSYPWSMVAIDTAWGVASMAALAGLYAYVAHRTRK